MRHLEELQMDPKPEVTGNIWPFNLPKRMEEL